MSLTSVRNIGIMSAPNNCFVLFSDFIFGLEDKCRITQPLVLRILWISLQIESHKRKNEKVILGQISRKIVSSSIYRALYFSEKNESITL